MNGKNMNLADRSKKIGYITSGIVKPLKRFFFDLKGLIHLS